MPWRFAVRLPTAEPGLMKCRLMAQRCRLCQFRMKEQLWKNVAPLKPLYLEWYIEFTEVTGRSDQILPEQVPDYYIYSPLGAHLCINPLNDSLLAIQSQQRSRITSD